MAGRTSPWSTTRATPARAPRSGRRSEHATCEFSAILDADLEYRASDLAPLLAAAPRWRGPGRLRHASWSSHSAFSFWYVVGNKGVTLATNMIYNCWISDVMTCHKVMRTDLFRSLPCASAGSLSSPRSRARVAAGERIYEVPISYRARTREEGKKLTAIDGLRVLRTLVRCRVS